MKTTTLLTFLLVLSSALHAQIEKGRVQAGGNIGINYSKSKFDASQQTDKEVGVSISPSIGRFYATNRLAGLFLNYNYIESYSPSNRYYNYGAGVFLRQYKPVFQSFYVFAHESAGFNYIHQTAGVFGNNGFQIQAGLSPGLAYDISHKMQLELAFNNLIGVNYTHYKNSNSYSLYSSLDGQSLSSVSFGFRFYLK